MSKTTLLVSTSISNRKRGEEMYDFTSLDLFTGTVFFAPFLQFYVNLIYRKLELIQRRAARYVLHCHHKVSSVTDMLQTFRWRPLAYRRADAKLHDVHNC